MLSESKQRAKHFKGSIPAWITPFRDGEIDEEAFSKFMAWQLEEGVHGCLCIGTTGESATLRDEEQLRVIRLCVTGVQGRIPVIAGVGSNDTSICCARAVSAEKAGADALLVVTPYYNRPTQEGLYQHFKAVNDSVHIPIFLYNIPARSAVDLHINTMKRLYDLDNIVGVKDATGDIARIALQRKEMGAEFLQFSGEDMTALAVNAHGGHGCMSVTANVAPRLCYQLQEACGRSDYTTALAYQDKLTPLHAALFLEPGVSGSKYALARLQKVREEMRLPLLPVGTSTRATIDRALQHAGLLVT